MFDYDPLARSTTPSAGGTATEPTEQADPAITAVEEQSDSAPQTGLRSHYAAPPYAPVNDVEDDYGLGPEEPPTFDPPPYVPSALDVERRIPPPLDPAVDIPAPVGSPRFFAENGLSPEQYAPGNVTGPQITEQQLTGQYQYITGSITGQPGALYNTTAMGMMMEEDVPPEIAEQSWNAGAFLMPFGWCLRYRMPNLALAISLSFIAMQTICSIFASTTIILTGLYLVGEGMAATYLGLNGWRAGWKNRPPDLDLPGFLKEQKAWVSWGLLFRVVYIISIIGRLVYYASLPKY